MSLYHHDHLLAQSLDRRAELLHEAEVNRLLRGRANSSRLDHLLAILGARMVAWGTRLQQRSKVTTARSMACNSF